MSPTPIHPLSGVYAGVILEQRGDLNAMDQKVWFWRVARQPDLVKIRWLGPAQIVMKECKNDGTQLIRCAAHHVSADVKSLDHALADTQSALNTASRSRGVTRFYDLHRPIWLKWRTVNTVMPPPLSEHHEMAPPRQRHPLTMPDRQDTTPNPPTDGGYINLSDPPMDYTGRSKQDA